jgi:putative peptide zinc metalloprotease protein
MTIEYEEPRSEEALAESEQANAGLVVRIPTLSPSEAATDRPVFMIDRLSMLLGRDETCDIQLKDPTIADFHLCLHHLYEVVIVEDLGSPIGTLVNGTRLTRGIQLHEHDRLRLGDIELIFGWQVVPQSEKALVGDETSQAAKEGVRSQQAQLQKRREPSLWQQLEQRLSLAQMKPHGISEVVARSFTSARGEAYYMLKNCRDNAYLRLNPQQYDLWVLMDGTRSVQELTVEYFLRFGSFSLSTVLGLIEQLYSHGFLNQRPTRVYDRLNARFKRAHPTALVDRAIQRFFETRFPLRNIDRHLGTLYRVLARPFYSRLANQIYPFLVAIGVGLFFLQLFQGHPQVASSQGFAAGIFVLIGAYIFTITAHEVAHALTVKHFGGEVPEGGVMIYYGGPAFFANTTDIWLAPRRARLLTSWSGPYSGLIIASTLAAVSYLLASHPLGGVFFQAASIFYLGSLLNLNPLLELDGYYMLMDFLEIPLLRRKALAFVQERLFIKLRRRESFNKEEHILLWFGLMALLWSVFAFVMAIYFWITHLGGFVTHLWTQPNWWSRALAVLIVAFLAIPVLLIPCNLTLRLLTKLRFRWQLRHREAEVRRYRENMLTLKQLPFLAKIPERQLLTIARHARAQSYLSGSFIIRQGERGDRFYLILSGTVEVLEERESGSVPTFLRELGSGNYFGEIALIRDIPRTASVRALTNTICLTLERGVFQQLLQPQLELYERSKHVVEEQEALASIPLFASLKPKERDLLASKLTRAHFTSGDAIVEQGSPGEYFYVIKSGHLEVSMVDGTGQKHPIRTLGPGQYFGEIALLLSVPRTATVRAIEEVEVWMLHRRDFTDLLTSYLSIDAGALATLSGAFNAPDDLIPLEHRSLLR